MALPAAPAAAEGEAKPLRGPAAMLAKAMEESRSIPTATSFRTLAVDTLDAKRRALNEVLKERGMKISLTHLIAWAIVKAAQEWPVMGRSYEERDGKPTVVEPASVNLGIAVDVERKGLAQPDGPLHQGRGRPRLHRLPLLLRGADHQDAGEQPHRGRLQGDQHQPHQSGWARDGRVGAAPDERPGDDRRLRLARLSGGVEARAAREDQGARHLEGHDDDLDL